LRAMASMFSGQKRPGPRQGGARAGPLPRGEDVEAFPGQRCLGEVAKGNCENLGGVLNCENLGGEEVHWRMVGERQGDYEMVPNYTYVGSGRGSFDKEILHKHRGCRINPKWLSCFACTAACLGMAWLSWWMVQMMFNAMFGWIWNGGGPDTTLAPAPYDCEAGYDNWQGFWSEEQQDYCCQAAGRACPTVPFDCEEGWEYFGEGWDVDKKAWCCVHYARGCPTTTTATTTFTVPMYAPVTWPSTTTPQPTTWVLIPVAVEHDCDHQYETWMTSWSVEKQVYCCTHAQKGCIKPPSPEQPFTCSAGQEWMHLWAPEKLQWCCANEQIGCQMPLAQAAVQLTAAPPGAQDYDCNVEFETWQTAWGQQKQEWCCHHFSRACGGSDAAHQGGAGCTTTPTPNFNCDSGFANWAMGWSPEKKEFCCRTRNMGCEAVPMKK